MRTHTETRANPGSSAQLNLGCDAVKSLVGKNIILVIILLVTGACFPFHDPPLPESTYEATPQEKVHSQELVKLATLLQKGDPAPNFKVALFDGSSMKLSDLEGHPLVINFWASWCAPCRWEMPEFEESWNAHKQQGIRFVGIATQDVEHESRRFADEVGISYPVGFDSGGNIALAYGVTVLPTTYFVDRNHLIHRSVTGAANAGALSIFLRAISPK